MFESLISRNGNLVRAMIFIYFLVIICLGSFYFIVKYIIKKDIVSIESVNGNLKVFFEEEKKTIYFINFHPSILWKDKESSDDEIEIHPGDSICIKASGRYNPTVHHLTDDARLHKELTLPWCGPKGIKYENLNRRIDRYRIKNALMKDERYGALLMQFVPKGQDVENRPKPDRLFYIGTQSNHFFKENGKIYFAVNEVPLDESMKNVYVVPFDEYREYYDYDYRKLEAQKNQWDSIVKNKYWNVWYADNIGSISITVEVVKK